MSDLSADYDRDSDVLYLTRGAPEPCHSEEGAEGWLYRKTFAGDEPNGVTVLYAELWVERVPLLAKRVSSFLGVDEADALNKIQAALGPTP